MTKTWMIGLTAAATLAAAPATAATIVNISATDAATFSSTVTLGTGRYEVSLIEGLYTAWAPARIGVDSDKKNIPGANWTGYYDYTIGGTTTRFNPQNSKRYATALDALAAYSASGPLKLTLSGPTAVKFAIGDYPNSLRDNTGGLSLLVAAVPEPSTWAMLLVGFFTVGAAMRRTRRQRATVAA